jgi:type II secretory pathway pseudopilin PulG
MVEKLPPVLRDHRAQQTGFTYLGILIAVAVVGIGLTAASEVWVATSSRQKMTALDWAGQQYIQAIRSYYQASPGSVKSYPMEVADLLEDRRFLTIRRHLRTAYLNPFTQKADWNAIRANDGSLRGVQALVPQLNQVQPKSFTYIPTN